MTHATPRPWSKMDNAGVCNLTDHSRIYISDNIGVAVYSLGAEPVKVSEHAALIVQCVNTFDEAKAALTHVLCDMEFHGLTGELGYRMSKAVLAKLEGGAR